MNRNEVLTGLLRRRQQIRFVLMTMVAGAVMGFLFLYPINEFVYYHEHEKFEPDPPTASRFVTDQMLESLHGRTPQKTTFYLLVGAMLGLLSGLIHGSMHRKLLRIQQLSDELGRDLRMLIREGEGPTLEFKSTFRWDLKQSRVNRALEAVVLKTLAGFMNNSGGTLLIGIADDGRVVGLDYDYQTLKKPDRDGFEQAVMTAVANNLGADVCQFVQILFHRLDDQDVCRLIVSPSSRPVFIKQGNTPKLYVRTGGGTRELNIEEAMQFIGNRWRKA